MSPPQQRLRGCARHALDETEADNRREEAMSLALSTTLMSYTPWDADSTFLFVSCMVQRGSRVRAYVARSAVHDPQLPLSCVPGAGDSPMLRLWALALRRPLTAHPDAYDNWQLRGDALRELFSEPLCGARSRWGLGPSVARCAQRRAQPQLASRIEVREAPPHARQDTPSCLTAFALCCAQRTTYGGSHRAHGPDFAELAGRTIATVAPHALSARMRL